MNKKNKFVFVLIILLILAFAPFASATVLDDIFSFFSNISNSFSSAIGFGYQAALAGQQTFEDVSPDFWAYPQIEAIHSAGITQGYIENGKRYYHPEYEIDRAQIAVFLVRAMGLEPYNNPTPTFADVPTDFWAYQYIEALHKAGIVQGYPDGLYHPEYIVGRDQMAVFLVRALGLNLSKYDPNNKSTWVAVTTQLKKRTIIAQVMLLTELK